MRVLVIGPIPPPFGGGEIMMLETIKALKSRGVDVIHVNTSIREFNKDRMKVNAASVVAYLKIYFSIYRVLKRNKFDAIYFSLSKKKPGFVRNIPYIILAASRKVKVVGHIHGGEFEIMGNAILSYFARKIDLVLVLSEELKFSLRKDFKPQTKIEYLCNGIEIINDQQELRPSLNSLIYVGNLVPKKGIIRLARIFKSLCEKHQDVVLNLVGEWHDDEVKRQFYSIVGSAKSKVIEHGYIPNEKVKEVMPSAGLLVHPTEYDGQPISIIEAYAFGLPVVSTKIGGIPHMIDHEVNGFLVNEIDNYTTYVDFILSLIEDDFKYQKFQTAALENYKNKFSLESYGTNLLSKLDLVV